MVAKALLSKQLQVKLSHVYATNRIKELTRVVYEITDENKQSIGMLRRNHNHRKKYFSLITF